MLYVSTFKRKHPTDLNDQQKMELLMTNFPPWKVDKFISLFKHLPIGFKRTNFGILRFLDPWSFNILGFNLYITPWKFNSSSLKDDRKGKFFPLLFWDGNFEKGLYMLNFGGCLLRRRPGGVSTPHGGRKRFQWWCDGGSGTYCWSWK